MKKNDSSAPADRSADYQSALQRAASYCSRREVASRHVLEKLRSWEVPESWREEILEWLIREKYVDDQRFATLFVKEKFNLNRWGRVKIVHMLRSQGIGEGAIQEALVQIDEEEYFRICRELIRNKSATLKDKNQFTRKSKLFRYAAGKGYESDLIYSILNDPAEE
ncbi:MAG: regulatory protein RecX [Bacteroidales bacterium]